MSLSVLDVTMIWTHCMHWWSLTSQQMYSCTCGYKCHLRCTLTCRNTRQPIFIVQLCVGVLWPVETGRVCSWHLQLSPAGHWSSPLATLFTTGLHWQTSLGLLHAVIHISYTGIGTQVCIIYSKVFTCWTSCTVRWAGVVQENWCTKTDLKLTYFLCCLPKFFVGWFSDRHLPHAQKIFSLYRRHKHVSVQQTNSLFVLRPGRMSERHWWLDNFSQAGTAGIPDSVFTDSSVQWNLAQCSVVQYNAAYNIPVHQGVQCWKGFWVIHISIVSAATRILSHLFLLSPGTQASDRHRHANRQTHRHTDTQTQRLARPHTSRPGISFCLHTSKLSNSWDIVGLCWTLVHVRLATGRGPSSYLYTGLKALCRNSRNPVSQSRNSSSNLPFRCSDILGPNLHLC